MTRLARFLDTARALRDARDSATAHHQEAIRLRRVVAQRDEQIGVLRQRLHDTTGELAKAVDGTLRRELAHVALLNIKQAHDLELLEHRLADAAELQSTTTALLARYVRAFGDISEGAA